MTIARSWESVLWWFAHSLLRLFLRFLPGRVGIKLSHGLGDRFGPLYAEKQAGKIRDREPAAAPKVPIGGEELRRWVPGTPPVTHTYR